MKQKLIKTLSVLLAAAIVICSAPVSDITGIELPEFGTLFAQKAEAATSGACGDNLTWTFDESTGTLTISGTGEMNSYSDEFNKSPWSSSRIVKKVIIENGVMSIGSYAFYNCSNLKSVILPETIIHIGERAFLNTALYNDKSNWENGVLYIGNYLIDSNDALPSSYSVKEGTKLIADCAFRYRYYLTSINIANSVTSIGAWAFDDCDRLVSVKLGTNVIYMGRNAFFNTGYYNDKSNWENDVLYIGNHLIRANDTLSGLYHIKEGTKTIAGDAFAGCDSLTSVTIPDGVISIGSNAFYNCCLESVIIPESVTSIGACALCDLTNITVSDNNMAYLNDEYGVLYNKDKTVLIQYPTRNERTSYKIPDSVTIIAPEAFSGCISLNSITIPYGITSIYYETFEFCANLTRITLPDSVTSIGEGAFVGCYNLSSITIPDSVTSIGNGAFFECYAMDYIHIPSSVTTFGGEVVMADSEKARVIESIKDVLRRLDSETLEIYAEMGFTLDGVESWKPTTVICSDSENSAAKTYADTNGHEFKLCSGHGSTGNEHIHSYTSTITTPAACTTDGVMTYTCTECGDVYTEPILATGHNAGEWEVVTNSSCTAVGEKVKKCTVCGEILETEEIAMNEHTAGEWEITTNATCTENGEKIKKCVNCATVLENAEISATGHNQGSWVISIEPTCIEEGEMVAHCTECGVIVANEMISAKGHKAGAWITVLEPTTEAEGKKVKKCVVCDVILEEAAIAKLPKEPVKDSAVVKNPSTSKISYGDAIILHVDESKIPAGGRVEWTASNGNFSYKADGATCTISPAKSGDTTFTATIYDADGNAVSTDVQTMTSKAGFFDKIIAFFKKLFGLTKTYPDVFGI